MSFTYLSAFNADNSVQAPRGIIEKGDTNSWRRGRDPRAFGLGVDVEHVRLARENRLLTENKNGKKISTILI